MIETVGEKSQLGRLRDWSQEQFGLSGQFYFKSKMDFTDNVFMENNPNRDKEEVIWTVAPGGYLNFQQKTMKISASYEADLRYYTKYGDQNQQDQSLATLADLYPFENFYLRLTQSLNQRSSPGNNVASEPLDYLDHTVGATTGYTWRGWTPEFGFEDFFRNYPSPLVRRLDYDEDKFTWRLFREVTKDFKIYPAWTLGFIKYDKDSSRKTVYHEVLGGMVGKLPWKIEASASVGVNLRELSDKRHNDFHYFTTSVNLKRTFFEKTTLEAVVSRRPQEATFDDQVIFDEKLFYGGIAHLLTPKLRARANASLVNRDYEEVATVGREHGKRYDNLIKINLGADYVVRKWLTLRIEYSFNRQDSSFSEFDYTENQLSLSSTVVL
jgi:hypothetical protein